MWFATEQLQSIFKNDIDKFGDSFTAPTTVEQLREIFAHMDSQPLEAGQEGVAPRGEKRPRGSQPASQSQQVSATLPDEPIVPYKRRKIDIAAVEEKYIGSHILWGLFRGYSFYLDRFDPVKYSSWSGSTLTLS